MVTHVYIDGFNLYFGCIRGTRYKWLDLAEFCRRMLPGDDTPAKIRYFTARISPRPGDPRGPQRQQVYLPRRRVPT